MHNLGVVDRMRGRGHHLRQLHQKGQAAYVVERAPAAECLRHGDDVNLVAAVLVQELDHGLEHLTVRVAVEVFGTQNLGDIVDGTGVDEDGAQYGKFSLQVLGREAVDVVRHGVSAFTSSAAVRTGFTSMPGLAGTSSRLASGTTTTFMSA